MAIKVEEKYGGKREGGEGKFSREAEYNIIGTKDADQAYDEFYRYIQAHAGYRAGLPLATVTVEGNEDGASHFTGIAKYSNRQREIFDLGLAHYSFSTKGGTARVMFARQRIGSYGPSPPDFGHGINFVRDRGFEGVDIIVPKWTKIIKVAYPRTLIGYAYEAMLRRFTGCFNSHPFLGMAPGECFFNGADCAEGERRDRNGNNLTLIYDLTFEFLGMPNVTQEIPGIGPVAKRGWDYVWVYNHERPDPFSNRMITYPRNAFVDQVYDEMDFNVLGF